MHQKFEIVNEYRYFLLRIQLLHNSPHRHPDDRCLTRFASHIAATWVATCRLGRMSQW